jgi:hypothetical protein
MVGWWDGGMVGTVPCQSHRYVQVRPREPSPEQRLFAGQLLKFPSVDDAQGYLPRLNSCRDSWGNDPATPDSFSNGATRNF